MAKSFDYREGSAMKKIFKLYLVIWAALLAAFNIVSFVSVGWAGHEKYTPSFWFGYALITIAFLGQLGCAYFALRDGQLNSSNLRVLRDTADAAEARRRQTGEFVRPCESFPPCQ